MGGDMYVGDLVKRKNSKAVLGTLVHTFSHRGQDVGIVETDKDSLLCVKTRLLLLVTPESCPEKDWDIWVEGYAATGERRNHYRIGIGRGTTFREACLDLAKKDDEFRKHFRAETLSFWGCRLFPDRLSAARSFG